MNMAISSSYTSMLQFESSISQDANNHVENAESTVAEAVQATEAAVAEVVADVQNEVTEVASNVEEANVGANVKAAMSEVLAEIKRVVADVTGNSEETVAATGNTPNPSVHAPSLQDVNAKA